MSYSCNNVANMCNLMFINVAWFLEGVLKDLNEIRMDVISSFDEENKPIESEGRRRLQNAGLLKPYKYVNSLDEQIDGYEGDEDWLEPWDKV